MRITSAVHARFGDLDPDQNVNVVKYKDYIIRTMVYIPISNAQGHRPKTLQCLSFRRSVYVSHRAMCSISTDNMYDV